MSCTGARLFTIGMGQKTHVERASEQPQKTRGETGYQTTHGTHLRRGDMLVSLYTLRSTFERTTPRSLLLIPSPDETHFGSLSIMRWEDNSL